LNVILLDWLCFYTFLEIATCGNVVAEDRDDSSWEPLASASSFACQKSGAWSDFHQHQHHQMNFHHIITSTVDSLVNIPEFLVHSVDKMLSQEMDHILLEKQLFVACCFSSCGGVAGIISCRFTLVPFVPRRHRKFDRGPNGDQVSSQFTSPRREPGGRGTAFIYEVSFHVVLL